MTKKIVIVVIAILVPFLGRGLFFYSGFYSAPASEIPSYENIVIPLAPSTEYADVYEEGKGTVLIDLAHDNDFDIEELNVLTSRLVARGLTIELLSDKDDLEKMLLGKADKDKDKDKGEDKDKDKDEEEEDNNEAEKVSEADAFIVVCPQDEFSREAREYSVVLF